MNYYTIDLKFKQIPVSITSNLIDDIRKAARYFSYTICFTMLFLIFVDHDTVEKTSYFTYYNYQDKLIMRILTTVQLILTLLFFGLWLKMRSYLSLQKYLNQENEE